MKFLAADSDNSFLSGFEQLLAPYGECLLVSDGMQALDAYMESYENGNPFDVVTLEIMLPKIDGLGVIKSIRAIEKKAFYTKIVIVTSVSDPHFAEQAFSLGCDLYVTKPVQEKEIREVMEELSNLTY